MRRSFAKGRGAALAAVLFATSALAAGPAGPVILAPPDGYQTRYDKLWVVFRSAKIPSILFDGKEMKIDVSDGDIHHVLVEGVRAEGSVFEVRVGNQSAKRSLTLVQGGKAWGRFHGVEDRDCKACHKRDETTCGQCHPFQQSMHAKTMAKNNCLVCHGKPDLSPVELAEGCGRCHPDYTVKKHPKLKHPLVGGNDPARPGRGLDCASCHDPHTPACMSDMEKGELREWCRGCHSTQR